MGSLCGGEGDEENVDIAVPSDMEMIKEGDVNLMVYKGARMRKENDVIITETPDEYASRKFLDIEERFKRMEKELGDLKSAIKKLEEDGRKR
jgi:pyruvate/2-oxoacid:ferredoxin oxidoreductase beta subunit